MEKITPKIAKELEALLDYHPARRLSRGLRSLFMDYLITNGQLGEFNELPSYFDDLVYDLNALLEFLDVADEEWMWEDLLSGC